MEDAHAFANAVWNGDETSVATTLSTSTDLDSLTLSDYLHSAIEGLQLGVVEQLIMAGADINCSHTQHWTITPLMHAIDSESDHACQTNIPSENISLQITTLLLVSGAVITPETQHWANQSYGGNKILALFSTYHT